MKKNVGKLDRAIRLILGIGLISLVFVGPQSAWGWIGIIPLITAGISWCPIYRVFGCKTTAREEIDSSHVL